MFVYIHLLFIPAGLHTTPRVNNINYGRSFLGGGVGDRLTYLECGFLFSRTSAAGSCIYKYSDAHVNTPTTHFRNTSDAIRAGWQDSATAFINFWRSSSE